MAGALSGLHLRSGEDTFDSLQARATDALFFYPRQLSPEQSQFVVLVAIDDKSVRELKSYGRFPGWPRSLHAAVVQQLAEARARTVVFDVLFDVPAEDDAELAASIDDAVGRATSVVQPAAGDVLSKMRVPGSQWQGYAELLEPRAMFADVGSGLGMVDQDPDSDGTVRRAPLVFDVKGEPYPVTATGGRIAKFLRRPTAWDGPIVNNRIPLAGREIPIDERGDMSSSTSRVARTRVRRRSFPVVSFVDV